MIRVSTSIVREGCRTRAAIAIAFIVTLLAGASALAGDVVKASPDLSAREVVGIQLDALKALDPSSPGTPIRQVWALAHPANKAFAGTLSRFAAMLNSPGYDSLVGHRSHEVLAARAADSVVEFYVTVRAADGSTSAYVWVMQKVDTGEHAGCWMTMAVSPAVKLNRSA